MSWSPAGVERAMIQASRVIYASTRAPGPARPRAAHPAVVRTLEDALCAEGGRDPSQWAWSPALAVPDPAQIDRAWAVMDWLKLVDDDMDRRLLGLWIACRAFRERTQFSEAVRSIRPRMTAGSGRYRKARALRHIASVLTARAIDVRTGANQT